MKVKIYFLFVIFFAFIIANPTDAKSFKFAQLTDIHYTQCPSKQSNRDLSLCEKNLEYAVNSINKQDPLFTVFLGDNIDKSNEENLVNFLRTTRKLMNPYYFVLGNHDAYKLSGIPKKEYINYINEYNPYQKFKAPYYYFYPNKDTIAIVVDGAMPFAPSTHGEYTDEMLNWLDEILSKNKTKMVLLFQHFPIIPPYENYTHTIINPNRYLNIIKTHKNIVLISSGHYHKEKTTIDENGIYHISVQSLIEQPGTYQIVKISYDKKLFSRPLNVKVEINKIKI